MGLKRPDLLRFLILLAVSDRQAGLTKAAQRERG